jgi:hypothetical protein
MFYFYNMRSHFEKKLHCGLSVILAGKIGGKLWLRNWYFHHMSRFNFIFSNMNDGDILKMINQTIKFPAICQVLTAMIYIYYFHKKQYPRSWNKGVLWNVQMNVLYTTGCTEMFRTWMKLTINYKIDAVWRLSR